MNSIKNISFDLVPQSIINKFKGLNGISNIDQITNYLLVTYNDLKNIAKEYAKKDSVCKTAYEYSEHLHNVYFVDAFSAACRFLNAGFQIPNIKFIRKEIKNKNFLGQTSCNYSLNKKNKTIISYKLIGLFYNANISSDLFLIKNECVKTKWSTQISTALHEFGHCIQFPIGGYKIINTKFTEKRKKIAMNVSEYAQNSYPEFFAETIAGLLTGKKYPKEVLDFLPNEDDTNINKHLSDIDYQTPYLALLNKAKNNNLGSFVPKYIVNNISNNLVNYLNLNTYNYTEEQKKTLTYTCLPFVKQFVLEYEKNSIAQLIVDIFCSVMNRTFNFSKQEISLQKIECRLLDQHSLSLSGKNTKTQNEINRQIIDLIEKKGLNRANYTNSELAILPKYIGSDKGTDLLSAYYTPDEICKIIPILAHKYGYKDGGTILEPSCGIGNFLKHFNKSNKFICYELSNIAADITTILYPNAIVYNRMFETIFFEAPRFRSKLATKDLPKFDLVVGNPPYGIHKNLYSGFFTEKFKQIEHFFIYKCLELLKKDGLLIFCTACSLMQNSKTYQSAKEKIFKIATFVDAYRMPSIFAKTDITTDIIILKKK